MLDSFDEYRCHHGNHRKDFILNLLKNGSDRQVFPNSTVIMTSRPEAVNDIRKYFNRELEIKGFESGNLQTYTKKLRFLLNETIAATLENNPHIKLMCSTPLHPTMLVRLASVDVKMLSSLTTEISLYTQFLFMTVKQYKPYRLSWNKDSLEECFTNKLSQSELCQLFKNICKLAYNAMMNKKQWFSSTLLPKEYHDRAKNLSLFTIETRTSSLDDNNVFVYHFSHKTSLEFIAASH